MREVTFGVGNSLDNFIARADHGVDWLQWTDEVAAVSAAFWKTIDTVVMGRKTFISLRRPLPGRTNIVVTRDANFRAPGAVVTTSFADAGAVATGDALRRLATEIAVIGGAEIYAQWMDVADRLEITEVHARPEGDTRFATINAGHWEEVARVRHSAGPDDSADFSYVTYRRRKSH